MLNIIYTEFLKLKRAKVLLLIPIGGLLPPLLNFFVMLKYLPKVYPWEKNMDFSIMVTNLAMAIALFSLLAGYLYSREYSENTINTMFTYSIPRVKFIIAKLFVAYVLILATFALCFVFTILLGLLLPHEAIGISLLLVYSKVFFYMTIMHLALVPAAAFLALMGKNIIPPVALGITAVFVNVVVISSDYAQYFPWSIPGLLSLIHQEFEPSVYTTGIAILTATFVIGLAATIISAVKSDVLSRN